jgi:hypothetical protein
LDPSTTLSLTVTFAVIAAAVTHAAWNAIAHGIKDQTLAFALIGVGGTAVGIPLIIVAAMPRADCWPYLLGSVAIHIFYNLLLMRCYRLGEFGQVYPLARGTSPLVVTILAAIFIREISPCRRSPGCSSSRPGWPRSCSRAGGLGARPSWPPWAPA